MTSNAPLRRLSVLTSSVAATCTAAARVARLLALLACAALAGCGVVSKVTQAGASLIGLGPPKPVQLDWKSLVIAAAPDANDNSALAVDLVFVRDPALIESLLATPAIKWFAVRADTERAFPEGLRVISMEVVPSQYVRLDATTLSSERALAVFAFASYPSPGAHRERLLITAQAYLLQLGAKGFKAVEVKASAVK
jgi:type VI secretion system protein